VRRLGWLALLALPAACGDGGAGLKQQVKDQAKSAIGAAESAVARVSQWADTSKDDRPVIPCARDGAPPSAEPGCRIERLAQGGSESGELLLMLSHPDGGFRRLRIARSGLISAADGADLARVSQQGNDVTVSVAGDRYVLHAAQLEPGTP
jgi:hypothetical protein